MKDPKPELADFHQAVLMDDMMQVTGIDHLDAIDFDGGQSYVRARAKCHGCACRRICASGLPTLARRSLSRFAPMPRSFGL